MTGNRGGTGAPPDRVRRGLIGAGMVMPVVMTLRPASAWAVSLTGCQATYADADLTDPGVVDTISPSCQLSLGLTQNNPWTPT